MNQDARKQTESAVYVQLDCARFGEDLISPERWRVELWNICEQTSTDCIKQFIKQLPE